MVAPVVMASTTLLHYEAPQSNATRSVAVTAPGGDFYLSLACRNLPNDGKISVVIMGPDAASSVNFPLTLVLNPNMQMMWQLNWPENFQGELVLSYLVGATPSPLGSYIEANILTAEPATDNRSFAEG